MMIKFSFSTIKITGSSKGVFEGFFLSCLKRKINRMNNMCDKININKKGMRIYHRHKY